MQEKMELIESLLDRVKEYSKTSFELVKLKTFDKTSDVLSSLVQVLLICVFIVMFLLFLNLGIAFWLGKILGNDFWGFFIIGAFYGVIGFIIRVFMYKRLKRLIRDYTIKLMLKE